MTSIRREAPLARPPLSLRSGFATKVRRFALFPNFTATARLGIDRFLHRRRTEKCVKLIEAAGFSHLRLQPHETGEVQDPADLWHVYETIRALRPKRVLEFGSGQTTVFIAQALHDNGAGHLHSLDADARWLDNTRSMLPSHTLPFVSLIHSPVVVNRDYGEPAWEYTLIPEGEWDFVLIDGPAGIGDVTASCDLIHLADSMRPGSMGLIDHRCRTALLAREVLGDKLRIRYVPSLESFTFRPR